MQFDIMWTLVLCVIQLFDGNSACTQTEEIQQFGTPVIARYIRIIPMEWIGPMICFKMEIYGCFVRGKPAFISIAPALYYFYL